MNKPLRSNVPMVKRNATVSTSKLPISSISALRLQHAKSFVSTHTQSEDITDNLVFVCIVSIVITSLVLYCLYSVVRSHLQSKKNYHRKNRRVPTSASINSSNLEQDQKTKDEDEDISQIFSFEEEIISDVATFRRR